MSRLRPVNREEFKEKCLRLLGKGALDNIEVTPDQVDDCVEEALHKFWDYHFDGTWVTYLKHQITQQDYDNKYITVSNDIMAITDLFQIGGGSNISSSLFSLDYQIALNDIYSLTSTSLVPYVIAQQQLASMQQILIGIQPFRYNRHQNRLYIDISWSRIAVGSYIVAKCYVKTDPDVYTDVWQDPWLTKYATAMIKKMWGSNLSKYTGTLPGGITVNGDEIKKEAIEELRMMDEEVVNNFSKPVLDLIG